MLNIINELFKTLWLSVSSAPFYRDLYYKYMGYGIKYITMIISTTSIIYAILFMYNLNIIKEYLAPGADQENNPVEFILKNWPSLQYNGISISSDDPTPVYLTTQSGIKIAAIDLDGNLSKSDMQKVPLILTKDKAILSLGKDSREKDSGRTTFSYDKIFGVHPVTIDHDFIKNLIFTTINQVGIIAFFMAVPVLIVVRLGTHIFRNFFSIGLLYAILWWMRANPTMQSASRIVFFSSGLAEFVTPFILLIYQPLMPITMFIEYWAVMLAMYAIVRKNR